MGRMHLSPLGNGHRVVEAVRFNRVADLGLIISDFINFSLPNCIIYLSVLLVAGGSSKARDWLTAITRMAATETKPEDLLGVNDLIKDRWRIVSDAERCFR